MACSPARTDASTVASWGVTNPLDLGLQNGPDGRIYGFTSSCIYRLDPASLTVEELIHQEDAFQIAGPIVGDSILFAKVHRLMAARIF